MIKFLFKGIIRDRHRSLLPVLVVSIGVMLTVLFYCYFNGIMGEGIEYSAIFETGHVKVMSKPYADFADQKPNDLAMIETDSLMKELNTMFPDIEWVERISFGGLIDVPDENGETKAQGPAAGIAFNMLSENTSELERMKIANTIIRGKIPDEQGEILISEDFSRKLEIGPGDQVTLISSTMYGSMTMYNFIVSGTVRFGAEALDRGAILADISDIQQALNMEDAASEILGFFNTGFYDDELASLVMQKFNTKYADDPDEFAPVMYRLRDQSAFGGMLDMIDNMAAIISFFFIMVMSIVLWNTGLIGEFGIRLAMGEYKGHIYRSLVYESILIGFIGVIVGTSVGLFFSWLIQKYGINVGGMMKNASMMIPSVFHAKITPEAYFLGLIPGLFSTVFGSMLSGIGIYKRRTASLFKELEN